MPVPTGGGSSPARSAAGASSPGPEADAPATEAAEGPLRLVAGYEGSFMDAVLKGEIPKPPCLTWND